MDSTMSEKIYGDHTEHTNPVKINEVTWNNVSGKWETVTVSHDWHSESKHSTMLNYFGMEVMESGIITNYGTEATLMLPNRPNTYYECVPIN